MLTVLSGMSTEEQMKDNLSYMMDFKPLNEEEKRLVEEVARIIKSRGQFLAACRYCTGDCPREIAIPDYFLLYNDVKRKARRNTEVKEVLRLSCQKQREGIGLHRMRHLRGPLSATP